MVRKDRRARGWNKQNLAATDRLAAAGRRMGFEVDVDHGLRPDEQDFSSCLTELIGAEEFMAWREQGDAINLKAKDHQRELGQWLVVGEDMKAIAGEVADQRFKHSVYAAAADITGYTINTIKSFAHVVRNVPQEIMNEFPTLSFAHMKLVAKYGNEPDRQRNLLSEMLIGDLKVGQARDRIRLLDGEIRERKSKADRHATRLIAHCNHVVAELENFSLEGATPKVQETVLLKVEEMRRALEEAFEQLRKPALV